MRPSRWSLAVARGGRVALEQRVLGLRIERGGRLVEHEQQRAVAHEAARERELLPLAERHLDAARPRRPELRVEPAPSAATTTSSAPARATAVTTAGSSSRRGTSPTPTVCRARNSKRKKSWNAPASRVRHSSARMRASGASSTRIAPARRLVHLRQQLHERGLAGAVLADDRDDRARPADRRFTSSSTSAIGAGIRERDVIEADAAREPRPAPADRPTAASDAA